MIGLHTVARHWWIVLIRGLVAILFGIFAFAFPVSTVAAFVLLFGAFSLVEGAVVAFTALRFAEPQKGRWWAMLAQGVIGIAIGIVTFLWPGITAYALALLIAAWAFLTGFLEIGAAFRMRRDVPGEIFLIVSGVLSIALGVVLSFLPGAALIAWVWIVAVYAIVAGVALVALSFRLRGIAMKGGVTT